MTIQTLTHPAQTPANYALVATRTTTPRAIVAPEGSALASHLRSTGWIARAGWRSRAAGRRPEWLVRFESPVDSSLDAVA